MGSWSACLLAARYGPVGGDDVHPGLARREEHPLAVLRDEGERVEPGGPVPGAVLTPAVAEHRGGSGAGQAHVEAERAASVLLDRRGDDVGVDDHDVLR